MEISQGSRKQSRFDRLLSFLYQHSNLTLILLLALPLGWMVIIYLGSLASLLVNSFYRLDDFTGLVVREFSLRSYASLLSPANTDIALRTGGMALAVTIACAWLAFPLAYFIARYTTPNSRSWLYLAVLIPLWSSYLVRVYSWKLILAKEGVLNWFITLIGLEPLLKLWLSIPAVGGSSLSVSPTGMFIVFTYIWLPYMVLPILAALERVPRSLLEASSDLGGRPAHTFRYITLPLTLPGVVAGSIFTFSLTLGDFIVPTALGNSKFFIGQAVLSHQGTSGNIPLAAAMTMVPIVIMIIYLLVAKRMGAFEAL